MTMVEISAARASAYRARRELGSRSLRSFAAIREPSELVVVQRFAAGSNSKLVRSDGVVTLGVDAMNQLVRDAEGLARNWHPNIARVKHVDGDALELTIATDFVDGMTLGDLFAARSATPLLPLPVIVRVLVDVLAGLNALHALRDGTRATPTIHGAVAPANIVVGRDGVARIINCLRPRPVHVREGSEALAYASPEALEEVGTRDVRSDVYSVGVVLWQALMGMLPYEATDPVQLLARQRAEEVATPAPDAVAPFAGLGEIAIRAMAFEASLRYRTTAEMATALRKLAGAKIAPGTLVATTVAELAGDRMRARRAELDPKAAPPKQRTSAVRAVAAAARAAPPVSEAMPTAAAGARAAAKTPALGAPGAPAAAPPTAEPVTKAAPAATPPPLPARAASAPALQSATSPSALPEPPERRADPRSSVRIRGPSPIVTPSAVVQRSVEAPSAAAFEAPPPRRRMRRAAVIVLLSAVLAAALAALLVAGTRHARTGDTGAPRIAAGPGTPAARLTEPLAPTAAAADEPARTTPTTRPPGTPALPSVAALASPPGDAPAPPHTAAPTPAPAAVAAPRVERKRAVKTTIYDPLGI